MISTLGKPFLENQNSRRNNVFKLLERNKRNINDIKHYHDKYLLISFYPVRHSLSTDLAVLLYKGMRDASGVNDGLRDRKVRDSGQQVVSVAERTPAILRSEQNMKFSNLNRKHFGS